MSVKFSFTLRHRTIPCAFLSSGTNPIPFLIASLGELIITLFPFNHISPVFFGSAPKIALKTSLLPEPTRPARPNTSPFLSTKEISDTYRLHRSFTSNMISFEPLDLSGYTSFSSRPTILTTNCSMEIFSLLKVPT